MERGVPKDHVLHSCCNHAKIILMIADEMSCTARNNNYGHGVISDSDHCLSPLCNVFMDRDEKVVIHYHGDDVTLDSFVGILTSAHAYRDSM